MLSHPMLFAHETAQLLGTESSLSCSFIFYSPLKGIESILETCSCFMCNLFRLLAVFDLCTSNRRAPLLFADTPFGEGIRGRGREGGENTSFEMKTGEESCAEKLRGVKGCFFSHSSAGLRSHLSSSVCQHNNSRGYCSPLDRVYWRSLQRAESKAVCPSHKQQIDEKENTALIACGRTCMQRHWFVGQF